MMPKFQDYGFVVVFVVVAVVVAGLAVVERCSLCRQRTRSQVCMRLLTPPDR